MNLSIDIKPISLLGSNSSVLLEQLEETHRPIILTQDGEAKAVLQDTESYEKMQKAIGLLKLVALGERAAQQGELKPQEQVFADLEKLL